MSASGIQPTFDAPAEESFPAFVLMVPSLDLKVEVHIIWGGGDDYDVTLAWPQHKEHGSERTQGAEDL